MRARSPATTTNGRAERRFSHNANPTSGATGFNASRPYRRSTSFPATSAIRTLYRLIGSYRLVCCAYTLNWRWEKHDRCARNNNSGLGFCDNSQTVVRFRVSTTLWISCGKLCQNHRHREQTVDRRGRVRVENTHVYDCNMYENWQFLRKFISTSHHIGLYFVIPNSDGNNALG